MKTPGLILCLLLSLASMAGAADFSVTNASNGGPGSLRQAILDANATPNAAGQDRIIFNIPGPGAHVIDVSSQALPEITDPVIIDGYSQPGARPNALAVGSDAVILIQIHNSQHNLPAGLLITGGNSIVRGLSITGFSFDTGGGRAVAINLMPPGTGNIVEGNFIGLRPDGITPDGNGYGVRSSASGSMIGGKTPQARNVISSNDFFSGAGIAIFNSSATVSGNYVGTDASGTVVRTNSQQGIYVEDETGHGVVIGGTEAGAGNLISGNHVGIRLGRTGSIFGQPFTVPARGVTVRGNKIGLASNGAVLVASAFQTRGIDILAGSDNMIGGLDPGAGNVIAFKRGFGVTVDLAGSINNSILSNSIYGRGVGIKLGEESPQPNDALDADDGPNHNQNFPIITATQASGNGLVVNGTLHSSPNAQFTIQFFADNNDFLQPGQTFLGSTNTATDSSGNATFSATVPFPSGNITLNATATDSAGNTSEFFLRPSHFRNISTRARVQPGEGVLIGGFITGDFSRRGAEIIVRAIGPSLSVGGVPLAGRLEDPTLELRFSTDFVLKANDNWRDNATDAAEIEKWGLAPTNDLESALVYTTLAHDSPYTVILQGKNNSSGIAVVEVYEVLGNNLRPVNISTRGLVQPGDNVMIGGVILGGGFGGTAVVARAIGPSLSSFGIANPLSDPTLELRDGNGGLLASNDNWQETQAAELNAAALAPTDPAESAIFALLGSGAYTAIVRGKGASTGIALVEFYQLP